MRHRLQLGEQSLVELLRPEQVGVETGRDKAAQLVSRDNAVGILIDEEEDKTRLRVHVALLRRGEQRAERRKGSERQPTFGVRAGRLVGGTEPHAAPTLGEDGAAHGTRRVRVVSARRSLLLQLLPLRARDIWLIAAELIEDAEEMLQVHVCHLLLLPRLGLHPERQPGRLGFVGPLRQLQPRHKLAELAALLIGQLNALQLQVVVNHMGPQS